MALKLVLKPGERLYVGSGQISVESDTLEKIYIDGHLPVVREKDYLPEDKATSPARRVYLTLQRAYLQDAFEKYQDDYFRLIGELMVSSPGSVPYLGTINEKLGRKELYGALKSARTLVQFDEGQLAAGEQSAQWDGF